MQKTVQVHGLDGVEIDDCDAPNSGTSEGLGDDRTDAPRANNTNV